MQQGCPGLARTTSPGCLSGLRHNAFRRERLSVIGLEVGDESTDPGAMRWGDGFEVEANVRIANVGPVVAEVPSFEHNRHFGGSNLNAFSDGIRVLRTNHGERKRGPAGPPAPRPPRPAR